MNEHAKTKAGTAPASLAERFAKRDERVIDAPELGAVVIIKEAKVGDIMPIVQAYSKDPVAFGRKVVALCVTVDGEPLTEEVQLEMGMQHFKALNAIMPQVMQMNGMEGDEAKTKND